MKIFLDGVPLSFPSSDLSNPTFTLRKVDETGDRAFSFTGDLVFTGSDAAYLKARLIDDINAIENKVVLKFIDDCCTPNPVYEFYINSDSLLWCEGSCDITASATEKSIANDQFTCLKNTIIWDNFDGFTSRQHPRMSYCNELRPDFMQHFQIIVVLALYTAFLTMGPILAVIAAIIVVINFIIGINNTIIDALNSVLPSGSEIDNVDPIDLDNDPGTNAFAEFDNWIQGLIAIGVGCGRKHPSPLLREYINNFCKKCGLSFKSSIINNPGNDYWNTVYVNAPIHKGIEEADNTTFWVAENAPLLSGLQLMDQLVPVFNGRFEVTNNELTFERKDYFVPKTPWLDLTTHPGVESVCWNWSKKTRFSYAVLSYQEDAINQIGNEARERWRAYVEWNIPYSTLQKGAYEPILPFAACRFRDDGIDKDILTFYKDQPTLSTLINRYRNSMIMNTHTSYLPMLLIWDGDSVYNAFADKFINKNYLGIVGLNQAYNYPYWFAEGYPGNLYSNFHYIENPKLSGYQGFDFTAEVRIDCDLINAIDIDGVVKTSRGDSKDSLTVVIDRKKGVLTIKGTV